MSRSITIALLGTGLLGRAIAERLQSVGHIVTVYNRTATKAFPLRACGITVVTRPEQAMAEADCVVLMLADAAAIRAALRHQLRWRSSGGKTVIQMGTIDQEESLALQAEIEQVGGSHCEAPMLGSLSEAQAGTLFVMVGGTEEQFIQWGPLFGSLSREPPLAGPVGKAASLRLALNQLIAAEISAFALSLGLMQRAGVPVDIFMAILRESTLFAQATEKKRPRLLTRDYQHQNFSIRHLLKDVELFLKDASGYELTTGGPEGIRPVLERTIAQGLGDSDYSAIFEIVNPIP